MNSTSCSGSAAGSSSKKSGNHAEAAPRNWITACEARGEGQRRDCLRPRGQGEGGRPTKAGQGVHSRGQ